MVRGTVEETLISESLQFKKALTLGSTSSSMISLKG